MWTDGFAWWAVHLCVYWYFAAAIINDAPPEHLDAETIVHQVLFNQFWVTLPWFLVLGTYPPTPQEPTLLRYAVAVVMLDAAFFVLHRLAHTRWLYDRVHRTHHELREPYAPGAAYCSALEHGFVNLLSGTIPAYACGFSLAEIEAWIVLGTVNVVWEHSRFSPTHFPHHTKRAPKYGSSLGLMDFISESFSSRRRASRQACSPQEFLPSDQCLAGPQ